MKETTKETRLSDDASIYSKREPQKEKEKWSTLTRSEKLQYFKDYYLKVVLIIIIAAVFIIQLLYSVLSPKPDTVLSLSIVNGHIEEEVKETLIGALSDYLSLDTENQEIYIDTSIYLDENNLSEMTVASEQKLSVYAYSGEIDLIIIEREFFLRYAKSGFFTNLTEAIPADLYPLISDRFLMAEAEDIDTKEVPYGFSIKGFKRFDSLNTMMNDPIIGIMANSKNKENALSTLQWFTTLN